MELLQLKYFFESAVSENFSLTAKKYGVPQSAVSQSIKKLEAELGIPLFDRNINKIHLNHQGQIFLGHIETALQEIEKAKTEIKENKAQLSGNLSILIRTNRRFITKCVAEFKEKFPLVNFSLYYEYVDFSSDMFDLIVDEIPPKSHQFKKTMLIKEKISLLCSKSHPFAQRQSVAVAELENESFISMQKNSSLYYILENMCRSAGINPNISIFCNDPHYIRQYIAMNLGIALFPEFSWDDLITNDTSILLLSDLNLQRNTYVFYKPTHNPASVVTLFKEFMLHKLTTDK